MIKELKAHHRNIIQMSFNGFSAKDISERLEISTITVSNVLNSPLGKAYMNGLNDDMKDATLDVRKELISMNRAAIGTLSRLLNPKTKAPASVQLNTAKDILDRSGYKAPDKLNIDMHVQTKTDEEIDAEITALENSILKTKSTQPSGEVAVEEQAAKLPIPDEATTIIPTSNGSTTSPIDEESQAILNDDTFDPFKNIEESNE